MKVKIPGDGDYLKLMIPDDHYQKLVIPDNDYLKLMLCSESKADDMFGQTKHSESDTLINAIVKNGTSKSSVDAVSKSVCLFVCCIFCLFVHPHVMESPVNAKVEKCICEQICESRNVLNCYVSPLPRVLSNIIIRESSVKFFKVLAKRSSKVVWSGGTMTSMLDLV